LIELPPETDFPPERYDPTESLADGFVAALPAPEPAFAPEPGAMAVTLAGPDTALTELVRAELIAAEPVFVVAGTVFAAAALEAPEYVPAPPRDLTEEAEYAGDKLAAHKTQPTANFDTFAIFPI
jgi:hypothetical protein